MYSAILNVPTNATAAEIRERYRALAGMSLLKNKCVVTSTKLACLVVLHPDKQSTDELRNAAQGRFHDVQKAYEGACPLIWNAVLSAHLLHMFHILSID
jgi:hypothetical protein